MMIFHFDCPPRNALSEGAAGTAGRGLCYFQADVLSVILLLADINRFPVTAEIDRLSTADALDPQYPRAVRSQQNRIAPLARDPPLVKELLEGFL